jgi:hypothetical protein
MSSFALMPSIIAPDFAAGIQATAYKGRQELTEAYFSYQNQLDQAVSKFSQHVGLLTDPLLIDQSKLNEVSAPVRNLVLLHTQESNRLTQLQRSIQEKVGNDPFKLSSNNEYVQAFMRKSASKKAIESDAKTIAERVSTLQENLPKSLESSFGVIISGDQLDAQYFLNEGAYEFLENTGPNGTGQVVHKYVSTHAPATFKLKTDLELAGQALQHLGSTEQLALADYLQTANVQTVNGTVTIIKNKPDSVTTNLQQIEKAADNLIHALSTGAQGDKTLSEFVEKTTGLPLDKLALLIYRKGYQGHLSGLKPGDVFTALQSYYRNNNIEALKEIENNLRKNGVNLKENALIPSITKTNPETKANETYFVTYADYVTRRAKELVAPALKITADPGSTYVIQPKPVSSPSPRSGGGDEKAIFAPELEILQGKHSIEGNQIFNLRLGLAEVPVQTQFQNPPSDYMNFVNDVIKSGLNNLPVSILVYNTDKDPAKGNGSYVPAPVGKVTINKDSPIYKTVLLPSHGTKLIDLGHKKFSYQDTVDVITKSENTENPSVDTYSVLHNQELSISDEKVKALNKQITEYIAPIHDANVKKALALCQELDFLLDPKNPNGVQLDPESDLGKMARFYLSMRGHPDGFNLNKLYDYSEAASGVVIEKYGQHLYGNYLAAQDTAFVFRLALDLFRQKGVTFKALRGDPDKDMITDKEKDTPEAKQARLDVAGIEGAYGTALRVLSDVEESHFSGIRFNYITPTDERVPAPVDTASLRQAALASRLLFSPAVNTQEKRIFVLDRKGNLSQQSLLNELHVEMDVTFNSNDTDLGNLRSGQSSASYLSELFLGGATRSTRGLVNLQVMRKFMVNNYSQVTRAGQRNNALDLTRKNMEIESGPYTVASEGIKESERIGAYLRELNNIFSSDIRVSREGNQALLTGIALLDAAAAQEYGKMYQAILTAPGLTSDQRKQYILRFKNNLADKLTKEMQRK